MQSTDRVRGAPSTILLRNYGSLPIENNFFAIKSKVLYSSGRNLLGYFIFGRSFAIVVIDFFYFLILYFVITILWITFSIRYLLDIFSWFTFFTFINKSGTHLVKSSDLSLSVVHLHVQSL